MTNPDPTWAVPGLKRDDKGRYLEPIGKNADPLKVFNVESIDGEPAKEVWRSTESIQIGGAERGGFVLGGLSADGSLLCLEHGEYGDLIHPALRVIDPKTGATVGEQVDEGMSLYFQDGRMVYAVSLPSGGLPLPGWRETYSGDASG